MSRTAHHRKPSGPRRTKRHIPEGRTTNALRRGDWDALPTRETNLSRRTR